MLPLDSIDPRSLAHLKGLLFDLDDTLLTHGELTEVAFASLHRLHRAGFALLGVTGRPAGWGEVLTRMWPIDGMVTENGSVCILRKDGELVVLDEAPPAEREVRRKRLHELVLDWAERFPELRPADDTHLRRSDFTFDLCHAPYVTEDTVSNARAAARLASAFTVRSSVHLHVGFDGSNKASGALRAISHLFDYDPTVARYAFAFVGDSENDEPAFAGFQTTFGVANLRGRPSVPPRYLTREPGGEGFGEIADLLCQR